MSVRALFVGGPIDGEEMELNRPLDIYTVPVFSQPPMSYCIDEPLDAIAVVDFERVDYRRVGSWSQFPRLIYAAPDVNIEALRACPSPYDLHAPPTATFRVRATRTTEIADYLLPDAHTVRFSEMSAEAKAELAAWDEMLHGRKTP